MDFDREEGLSTVDRSKLSSPKEDEHEAQIVPGRGGH